MCYFPVIRYTTSSFTTLDLSPIVTLTRTEFHKLCVANPDLKLERSAKGELIVRSPTGGETGNRNSELTSEVVVWNKQYQTGKTFDSSTGFALPQGGDRTIGGAVLLPQMLGEATGKCPRHETVQLLINRKLVGLGCC